MGIQANSVTAKTVRIKSPNAVWFDVQSVIYTAANGQAAYKFSKTFTAADNGNWQIWTNPNDSVLDTAGNKVVEAKLGDFQVNILTPSDTTPPTATLISATPANITAAGNAEISIVVAYAD